MGGLLYPLLIHDRFKAIIEIFSLIISFLTFFNVLLSFLLRRLKLECEKLASEKTEMQRHYVMVSEMFKA